ncbi:Cupin 2 conserved barrel domain protein [Haladaptatus paucihalophilus DX253]|uniref:Cupin 2 conserved barrel domain protein n=2 Tax=Haladaptatus paucihalophilus DX253 TaxID=797209 RepID=E7QQP1_HALPU|nr:Cupin 2 conserved barrel domain protein [Haladaptatus paucihalophilus DX253]
MFALRERTDMTDERPRIINESNLDWEEKSHGQDFHARRKRLGAMAGGEQLGCSLYELPPGKKSWPYHYHTGNEEAIFVLDGNGTLRTEDEETSLEAGDYVAFPVGEEYARRVVNDSDDELRYLCFSTMREPDVSVYPDSGKFGVFAGSAPGDHEGRTLAGYFPLDAEVGYWEGEDE